MTITTPARKSGSVAVARIKETVTKRGTPARQGDALAAHLLTMQLALSPEHIEKPFALPQWAAAIGGMPKGRGFPTVPGDNGRKARCESDLWRKTSSRQDCPPEAEWFSRLFRHRWRTCRRSRKTLCSGSNAAAHLRTLYPIEHDLLTSVTCSIRRA